MMRCPECDKYRHRLAKRESDNEILVGFLRRCHGLLFRDLVVIDDAGNDPREKGFPVIRGYLLIIKAELDALAHAIPKIIDKFSKSDIQKS